MNRLVMVAAVGPFVFCVFVVNAVIRPFPDTAAHELIGRIEKLHIFFESARAVAHGVGIFALEEGLALIFASGSPSKDFPHQLLRAVHS